jgi:ATP phosphoribosyltransferase-like protein
MPERLAMVALNMAASKRRRKKPTVSVELHREATGFDPVARDGQPSGRIEQRERVAQVRKALAKLADEFRTVLVLREIDGHLDAVLAVLPALKRPTISTLSEDGWLAVNTILEESTVRTIIPRLKAAGAQGIVEYPLNKIVL